MSTSSRKGKAKIVIVDDSVIALEYTRQVLQEAGYVVVASDLSVGFSALMMREQPDLALVDLRMPAIQGDKLVQIIRGNRRNECPIVLYSDRPEAELIERAELCGADGYICKTGDGQQLIQRVEQFLAGRKVGTVRRPP